MELSDLELRDLLLQYDPDVAIVMMLNYENNTNFGVDDILVGPPSAGVVRNTKVTLKVRRPGGPNDTVPWRGQIDFEYNRLSVAHHFHGVLGGLDVTLPTSAQVLLNVITERVGQRFVLDDFVLEDIGRHNGAAYRLKAKAESLRWTGEIVVRLGDLVDVGQILDNILPNIGVLNDAQKYSLPNVALPKLNATPYADTLNALPLGVTPQEGLALLPVFEKLAPTYTTPHYRAAYHDNAHFNKGTEGWFVNGVGPQVTVDFADNSFTAQFGGTQPALGTVDVTRQLTLPGQAIVELTYRLRDVESVGAHLPGPVSGELVLSNAGGFNRRGSLGPLYPGAHNAFAVVPYSDTYQVGLAVKGQNRRVAFTEIAVRSFPLNWASKSAVALGASIVDQTGNGTITMSSGGLLTFGTLSDVNVVDEMLVTLPVVAGRSYLLGFTPVQVGADKLQICLADGPRTLLTTIDSGEGEYRTGVAAYVAFTVPKESAVTQIALRCSDIGVTQTSINQLHLITLPLPYEEDALANPDFINDVAGITEINGADGAVTRYNGFLRAHSQQSTDYGVRFTTPALAPTERYTVVVRTQGHVAAQLPEANHYVEIKVSQAGGVIVNQTSGGLVGWNQSSPVRALNPTSLTLYGSLPSNGAQAPVVIELVGKYSNTGGSFTNPFSTLYRRVSVVVSYSQWAIDAGQTEHSLYNARLVSYDLPAVFPAVDPILPLTRRMTMTLDPSFSQEFSDGDLSLPFVPASAIPSAFLGLSQLTRNAIVAAEDASAYRGILSALTAGAMITDQLPATVDTDVTQDYPWVVDTAPAPKNLHGAVVQYNGPLRPVDPAPVVGGLDRVIVLQLSPTQCTGYKGQLRLYYFADYPAPPED